MLIKTKIKEYVDRNLLSFMNFKNFFLKTFKKNYYSQTGEDVIVSQLFKKEKKGFYVDVGAYHPEHYSNTKLLYKKGWRGINIDPNPKSISLFKKSRSGDINLNLGVSDSEKVLNYYKFSHPSCNTFSKEIADDLKKKSWIKYLEQIEIKCRTLSNILDEYVSDNKEIDLLSVDVEGFDLEVLKSNNWYKYSPNVVIVEGHGFDPDNPNKYEIYSFLKEKGYKLYGFTGLSLIFRK